MNEKMHGKGTYEYGNGDIYAGDFVDDKKHGYGLFQYGQVAIHINRFIMVSHVLLCSQQRQI